MSSPTKLDILPTPWDRNEARSVRLAWWQRLGLVLAGAIPLVLLVVAAGLRPDERGFGTHRQLGFPPCTVQFLFGVRCPGCGMTTAWSHMMHGRPDRAARVNLGGTLLAVLALVAGPWSLACGLRGNWLGYAPTDGQLLAIALGLLGVVAIEWPVRLLVDSSGAWSTWQ